MIATESLVLNFNKGGIYKIINTSNNKVYIGSTKSFKNRFIQHLSKLNTKNHYNSHLQNSYNKNKEYFHMDIVEIVNDLTSLCNLEAKYINLFDSTNRNKGYNLTSTTNSPAHDKGVRKKISNSTKKLMNDERESTGSWRLEKFQFKKGITSWNKGIKMTDEQIKNFHTKKTITPKLKEAHFNTKIRLRESGDIIACIDQHTKKELFIFRSISDAVDLTNEDSSFGFTVNNSRLCKAIKNKNLYKGYYFIKRKANDADYIRKAF